MKIIHCADIHLGSNLTTNLDREQAKVRRSELISTFKNMISYAKDNDVSGIIIAGDLYDTKSIPAYIKNVVIESVQNNPNIVFYYLRGNHDASSLLDSMDTIPDNLKLFEESWTRYDIGRVSVVGVEIGKDNSKKVYDSLVLDIDRINIVVMHGQEAENLSKDKTEIISIRELRGKGIDYLALGHIHSYKKGSIDARGEYCYSGCLEGRGFDECGDKGFVLLEIDEEERKIKSTFVPMAARRIHEISVDVSGETTTPGIEARVRAELDALGIPNKDMVKVILVGALSYDGEKNVDYIENVFKGDYYVFKLQDNTTVKVDYDAFALDQSLKGEFVRQVMAADDLSEEEKAAIVKCGVNLLLGEEARIG